MCVPDDAAAFFFGQTVLRALDGIILIVAANLFYPFIKNDKVVDQVKKTLFVEYSIKLLVQRMFNRLAFFFNQHIGFIPFFREFAKTVILPFIIMLFGSEKRSVAQALAVVSCHAELYCGKEFFDKMRCLVGQILPDSLGDRNATALEFYYGERNSVYIHDKIRALCIVADDRDLFGNGKIIFCGIFKIDKKDRFRSFAGFFGNLCPIFEQTVHLFVGIVQATLEVARRADKLVNGTTRRLVRIIALSRQICIKALLHNIAVFTVMQVAKICIMEFVHKEFDDTVLCYFFYLVDVRHSFSSFNEIKHYPSSIEQLYPLQEIKTLHVFPKKQVLLE